MNITPIRCNRTLIVWVGGAVGRLVIGRAGGRVGHRHHYHHQRPPPLFITTSATSATSTTNTPPIPGQTPHSLVT